MFLLWKIVVALKFVDLSIGAQFDNQYLGHHYTFDKYNKLELGCQTTICLRDAQRLLLAATQDNSTEPCENFPQFAMGQFIKLAALNDRYETTGFRNDLNMQDRKKFRKVLAAPINDNDIRPFKIAKKYYQNCFNSDNVRVNGSAKILQHLESLGGAPFLNSSWEEEKFNVKDLFDKEPEIVVFLFLNHVVRRCRHPQNYSQEIVCLKSLIPLTLSEVLINDIVRMFKEIKIDTKLTQSVSQKLNAFFHKQNNFSGNKETPIILTVSSLNNYTNNTLNWLKIINSQLTIESQLNEDSEILIKRPEKILKLLQLMKVTPKKTLADIFAFKFLYFNINLFIVYPFDEFEEQQEGTKKSRQRWEQCLDDLFSYHGPAFQALYLKRYFKKEVQESAIAFIKEVVSDLSSKIKQLNINVDAKQDVVEKLGTIKYIFQNPEEIRDLQKEIEEFYEDLELNGTEEMVETFLKMKRYTQKILNNPESNWKRKLTELLKQQTIKYYADYNFLYVSQKYIDYPFYHPNRPRFFNNANLFQETTDSLIEGINDYILQKWNIEIKFYPNLAYENYVNWENSGGKELKLPGFFLTNRQMYWVALAHTTYFKFHSHSAEYKMKYDYLFQYYQLQFKNNHYFREDFNCSKIDEDEEKTMKG